MCKNEVIEARPASATSLIGFFDFNKSMGRWLTAAVSGSKYKRFNFIQRENTYSWWIANRFYDLIRTEPLRCKDNTLRNVQFSVCRLQLLI